MDEIELKNLRRQLNDFVESKYADLLDLRRINEENSSDIVAHKFGYKDGINCLAFALGFSGIAEYETITRPIIFGGRIGSANIFASSEFLRILIERGLVKIGDGEELVLYYDQGNWRHAGLARGGRVLSKWNQVGTFYHQTLHVPEMYGTEICRAAVPDRDCAYEAFRNYAAAKLERRSQA